MLIILLVGILIIGFILYVQYENLNLEVTHYTVHSEKLPKVFQGVRFVVLADLHNNSFGTNNVKLLNEIMNANPEFILVAGDMIIGKEFNDYSVAMELLSKLAATYPIYYGYGNHEQRVMKGGDHYDVRFDEYKNSLQKMGVHFLKNGHISMNRDGEIVTITGLQIGMEYFNKLNQPKMKTEYIQNLVGIPNKQCYNIMIAHNPVHFKNYMEWGADLILSGHLHGGMVRLPGVGGIISPQYKLFPHYDAGLFTERETSMLVSRGLGMHTFKIRVFNRPELMVVTLEK